MTRAEIERAARRALGDLAPQHQAIAIARVGLPAVFCWSTQPPDTLWRIVGSARVVALVWGNQ